MQSLAQSGRALGSGVLRFLQWWRDELWGLLPRRMRAGPAAAVLVAVGQDGHRVFENAAGKLRPVRGGADLSPLDAVTAASELARANPAATVGIRVPQESCFVRHMELPRSAQDDAARILDLDLERATPFKLKDVYTAAMIEEGDDRSGRMRVRHMMIKRDLVEPVLGELRASGVAVGFIDCWREGSDNALPVNFLASQQHSGTASGRLVSVPVMLLLLAGLLGIAAIVLASSRYEAALAAVQSQVVQARSKATTIRRALDTSEAALTELGRLQDLKLATTPSVEVIDALTKLLPDTVWLTDLRLEGSALDVSGLAKSGAALLPLFEGSPLFADASMTSPLTFDQQENKERFSLRLRVRQPGGEPVAGGQEKR